MTFTPTHSRSRWGLHPPQPVDSGLATLAASESIQHAASLEGIEPSQTALGKPLPSIGREIVRSSTGTSRSSTSVESQKLGTRHP